jgi:transcriptional regulatory protein RtcR
MGSPRRTVVVGVLGSHLDAGKGPSRWERWRPTVAVCQHEDLLVDELWLLHEPRYTALARIVLSDIELVSPETRVQLRPLSLRNAWDFEEVYAELFDFAKERSWDPEREDVLVHITTGTHVVQICLFLLTESRHFPGRLLQTSPRDERDERTSDDSSAVRGTYGIVDLDLEKYEKLANRARTEHEGATALLKDGIATKSPGYNALVARVEEVAVRSKAPMLFLGPTGAGKSALARRVFALKKARQGLSGPFVEVNCATLRGDFAMSTLFGHKKGAFTGALADREGQLLRANRGVLFLDEIFELGLDEQAMLLRAIEDKTFTPMGADQERQSDFQLLCGTNADLFVAAREGRFRDDLLARLNLWTFRLPSLRERLEDLAPNLDRETEKIGRVLGTDVSWSKEARDTFLAFAVSPEATWPGNFRDLNASVTRLGTLAHGGRITRELVLEEIGRLREAFATGPSEKRRDELVGQVVADAASLDRFDRVQLEDVLSVCKEARSLSEAGRVLFAESRKTKGSVNDADRLRKYLARFGLELAAVQKSLGK